jgi:hypothetical protein
MLQSRQFMFCPQCQAEYLSHVRDCSNCGVRLVEHPHVTYGHSDPEKVSGFGVLKELAPIVAIPLVTMGAALLAGYTLRDNPWRIQIVSPILHTYAVFLFVFCDTGSRGGRDLKGYSLREKTVRENLPLIFYIHVGFLAVMFAVETSAILLRPHLSRFLAWEMGKSEPFLDCFDLIVFLTGIAIMATQIAISRRILGRALNRKNDDS